MGNHCAANTGLLPFASIQLAIQGDIDALYTVLEHYSGYIAALSMRLFYDRKGDVHYCVDESLRRRLETKLIVRIMAFDMR